MNKIFCPARFYNSFTLVHKIHSKVLSEQDLPSKFAVLSIYFDNKNIVKYSDAILSFCFEFHWTNRFRLSLKIDKEKEYVPRTIR